MLIKKKSGKIYRRGDIKNKKKFAFIPTCVRTKTDTYIWVWLETYIIELECICFDDTWGFYLWDCLGKYRLK